MSSLKQIIAGPSKRSKAAGQGAVKRMVKSSLVSLFHRAYRVLHRVRGMGFARSIAQEAARLPPEALAELSESIQQAHRMDYARHDIHLMVTSEPEVRRLRSAGKEPWTVEWIEKHVRPGDVVYDIGANVGAYALIVAKWTGGQARVYAFEPGCASYTSLCKNIVLNGCQDSITPLPVALAAQTSLVRFRYHSLLPGDAFHAMGDRQPGGAAAAVWDQPMLGFRLDDLVARFGLPLPNHVKLDVDGAEPEVLRGAVRALANPELRTVMMELNEEDEKTERLIGPLQAGGLRLVNVSRRATPQSPAYGLFMRESEASAA